MKEEIKKAIEEAARSIFSSSEATASKIAGDSPQEARARVALVREGMKALRETAETTGEMFDGGDLPFFCELLENLLKSCGHGGEIGASFYANGEDGEECAWEECREITIECIGVSEGAEAEDMGWLIGRWLAEICGLDENTEHDRDGRFETTWIYTAPTMEDVFFAAQREGKIKVLRAKIARYEGYCQHDKELVEKTGKMKYVNRLKNHEAKLARAREALAGWEKAGK